MDARPCPVTDDERELLGLVAEHLEEHTRIHQRPFKAREPLTATDLRRQGMIYLRSLAAQAHFHDAPAILALAARADALITRIERGEQAVMTPAEWDFFVRTEGLE